MELKKRKPMSLKSIEVGHIIAEDCLDVWALQQSVVGIFVHMQLYMVATSGLEFSAKCCNTEFQARNFIMWWFACFIS